METDITEHLQFINTKLLEGALQEVVDSCRQLLEKAPESGLLYFYLAHSLERQGNDNESHAYYQKVNNLTSDSIEQINRLGEGYFNKQLFTEAVVIFSSLARFQPENPKYLVNLANALMAFGNYESANQTIQEAIKRAPENPEAHNTAGLILFNLNQKEDARSKFLQALKVKPDFIPAVKNLMQLLLESNEIQLARMTYDHLSESVTENIQIKWLEISLLEAEKQFYQYEHELLTLLDNEQYKARAARSLTDYYLEEGRYEEARDLIQQFMNKQNPSHWLDLATLHLRLLDGEAAEFAARRANELLPEEGETNRLLGSILKTRAKKSEARDYFERAIRFNSEDTESLRNLTDFCKEDAESQQLLQHLEGLVDSASDKGKIQIYFAMGMLHEKLGHYDAAFESFKSGNDLKYQSMPYDHEQKKTVYAKNYSYFTKEKFKQFEGYGSNSKTPIFIVGMPRCGSTLCESILGSHSQIEERGERSIFHTSIRKLGHEYRFTQPYPQFMDELDEAGFKKLAEDYLFRLSQNSSSSYLVDKQLYNFEMLGVIAAVLPNAKFIHCTRYPLDTCLSCYFQIFSEGNEYTFNLEALGDYYQIYYELMQHWHSVLSSRIFTMNYEELTISPEQKTRELLEYLELEWEPVCLDFHNRKTTVVTSSVNQVRKSIYASSRQRWKHYESQLQPVIKRLQPLLDQWPTAKE